MMSLQDLLEQWRNQMDDEYSDCCNFPHHYIDDLGRLIPKPDSEVCKREQCWRAYVRARDNNPNFPFGSRYFI